MEGVHVDNSLLFVSVSSGILPDDIVVWFIAKRLSVPPIRSGVGIFDTLFPRRFSVDAGLTTRRYGSSFLRSGDFGDKSNWHKR